jgi:manganese transport protein
MTFAADGDLSHPHSLEEIHATVPVPGTGDSAPEGKVGAGNGGRKTSWWQRFLAFSGPAFLISVGYMDPGNWGTDLQAGSAYGHRLLWVLLVSNLMALLLQGLATRLGVVTGRDLAQACRESYPRRTVFALWVLCEIAIVATDLAEVIGTIIALKLLFNLPYLLGLAIAAADTFLLLALQRRGVRLLEVLTLMLVGVIAVSFLCEIFWAGPDWSAVLHGFIPGLAPGAERSSLYVAIAMLGATVMPHNLYLHSALVQTRAFPRTEAGKRLACRYNLYDSLVALNLAFLVNTAILVLAASSFFPDEVKTLTEAHSLLRPVWAGWAAGLFAFALLASGQSSTLTGTLAGQVVMEGFVRLRVRPWLRRLLTRSAAIVPAILVLWLASTPSDRERDEMATAVTSTLAAAHPLDAVTLTAAAQNVWKAEPIDQRLFQLLVLSQAILSFQLPFAILPLVQFTGDRRRMGRFASGAVLKAAAWLCAVFVVALNGLLIAMQMREWGEGLEEAGMSPWWIYATVAPLAVALGLFLLWVGIYPYRRQPEPPAEVPAAPTLPAVTYRRIGVAVEFTRGDDAVLAQAAALARVYDSPFVLIHVVEGPMADFHGPAVDDQESRTDRERMARLVADLHSAGLLAEGALGFGVPPDELVRIAREKGLDLLVLGTHGHRFFADLALGSTVSPVLHRLSIPILVVPTSSPPSAITTPGERRA